MTALKFANTVLKVALGFSILAFIYVVYRYRLDTSGVPALFYLVPALGAVTMAASLKLPAGARTNFALVVISAAFAVYACEVLLSLWSLGAPGGGGGEMAGRGVDQRSKLQVVQDLRSEGIKAYPAALPLHFLTSDSYNDRLLPLGGIANVTTVLCNEMGSYAIYPSDEHGFNNPKGLWSSESLEVAVVGDSFTHGSCVPVGKDVASEIRKDRPHTLGLGMSNNGPLLVLATIREYLPSLKPNKVIWMYFEGNDLSDIENEKDNAILRKYLSSEFSQGLLRRQDEVDSLLKSWINIQKKRAETELGDGTTAADLKGVGAAVHAVRNFLTLKHLRESFRLVANPPLSSNTCDLATFRHALSQGKKTVASWGGELYLAYLPSWGRYHTPLNKCEEMREEVIAAANTIGVPVIDVYHAFERHGRPRELFAQSSFSTHYNLEGYALVAQTVIDYLKGAHPETRQSE